MGNSYYYSYSSGSYGSSGSYDYGLSGSYGSSGSYDYGSSSCQDSWIGDGHCDDDNNIAACSYDGGDCCGDSVSMIYCSVCQCLDPGYVSYSSGSYATYDYGSSSCQDAWIGDGYCDDDNNCSTCQYDGGDCCGDNVQTIYCSDCQCLDPSYYGRNE